jgi:hypothetical protein
VGGWCDGLCGGGDLCVHHQMEKKLREHVADTYAGTSAVVEGRKYIVLDCSCCDEDDDPFMVCSGSDGLSSYRGNTGLSHLLLNRSRPLCSGTSRASKGLRDFEAPFRVPQTAT